MLLMVNIFKPNKMPPRNVLQSTGSESRGLGDAWPGVDIKEDFIDLYLTYLDCPFQKKNVLGLFSAAPKIVDL